MTDLARSQAEIMQRLRDVHRADYFGFESEDLVLALTADNFRALISEGVLTPSETLDLDEWTPPFTDHETVRKEAIDYMNFAWDKANGERGLSAGRSMAHYRAWLWLMGTDQFDHILEYQFYGKDHLVDICHYLDLDPDQWDDGERHN